MKAEIRKIDKSPYPDQPAFVWTYSCSCGHQGGLSSSRANAQKGINGHMNAHPKKEMR